MIRTGIFLIGVGVPRLLMNPLETKSMTAGTQKQTAAARLAACIDYTGIFKGFFNEKACKINIFMYNKRDDNGAV